MNRLSERSLLLLLAAVQFTHIVDFMILMPLGPQLMRELHIGPGHFSALVAAYTISSGVVGLLAAPFIDRFDRRKRPDHASTIKLCACPAERPTGNWDLRKRGADRHKLSECSSNLAGYNLRQR